MSRTVDKATLEFLQNMREHSLELADKAEAENDMYSLGFHSGYASGLLMAMEMLSN